MKSSLILAMVATFMGGAAFAHSENRGTTPRDGAELTETPEMIHMVFDDPMRVTMVRLVDGAGEEMPMERATGLKPAMEFHAEPHPLAPGRYTVNWRGLAVDGHPMQGSFTFRIVN